MAVDHHIGVVILDNFHEIELLSEILKEKQQTIKVSVTFNARCFSAYP